MGPAETNYRCYKGWVPTTGEEIISDTVVFFPPRKCTYDLPAPKTQEEVVQEADKSLGDSLRTLATNIPTFTHLSKFSGLQQMSDIINSAAKKASDSKSQESNRVTHQTFQEDRGWGQISLRMTVKLQHNNSGKK